MKRIFLFLIYYFLLFTFHSFAQNVQWASKLIDFSSEYKSNDIQANSTRYAASQILGYPNTVMYGESVLAWAPGKSQAGKEHVTVGYTTPQMVQQIIVGESFNAGAIKEIILYDDKGKDYSVYENKHPAPVQKYDDVLSYFKIKPVYNVVKLKLVLNTDAIGGMQQIDCIGISSGTQPYKPVINVIKYSEPIGMPENLGANVNSEYYDHLPIVSPDGKTLYFARKFAETNTGKEHKDDIYFSNLMPNGKWGKSNNIGEPLNTEMNNYVCFVSTDNKRLYLANKYKSEQGGVSMSTRKNDGVWGKPKALDISNYYNRNEFSCHHLSLDENVMMMCVQRDDGYGDLDIYVSFKYADGNWSEPMNVGPKINTVGAEASVFLAADNKTIYFSSTGRQGFGSYDVYMSKRLDQSWKNWSEPLNLGPQINTPKMDIYYTIPPTGDYIYYSSEASYYGLNDLYRIRLPKEARPEPVDMAKILANAPLKTQTPNTTNSLDSKLAQLKQQQKNPQAAITTPQTSQTPVTPVPQPTAVITKPAATNPPQDDLQKKLDALKQQQKSLQNPQPVAVNTPPAPVVKKEVLNSIQPYQAPKPAPKQLTQQEILAQQQIKNNPTINPANDDVLKLSQKPMSTMVNTTPSAPAVNNEQQPVTNNVINYVDPNAVTTPAPSPTLKTSTPQTDELQQKLDELKKQKTQLSSQPVTPASTTYTQPKTTAEEYPNPVAPVPTSNATSDALQQKLDALKQQQREVGQSNKIPANPYQTRPYDTQPLKTADNTPQQPVDDYQKKIDALKQQQKNPQLANNNTQPVINNTTPADTKITTPTPVNTTQPVINSSSSPVNTQPATNPIISKYEEKLKKLKEEMAAIGSTPSTPSTPTINNGIDVQNLDKPQPAAFDTKKEETPAPVISSPIVNSSTPVVTTPVIEEKPVTQLEPITPATNSADLEREKAKLDSIQQAQKAAEQKLTETLDKMGSSKQSLEKDIVDLQGQRTKFSEEKDKLTAQNSQLAGEKEKLELEKKKMDDLLAQMQTERDKLAAEKLKMEQDKAKLDLLKKQQERDVLSLKRSIDSLDKVQKQAANSAQLQQKYDLFNVPLEVGAVAQVNNIYFVADAAFLQIPSYPELDKVVLFLQRNKNLKVEVGGHTNGLCDDFFCQKLSTNRAKTCVDYLVSKGIAASRLSYKGYGKTQLLKPEAPGNSLNQRVEIKILSVN